MEKEIKKAIEILKNGGTILYPTDTIWGIGCDATNYIAVSKIFKIKKRKDSKALISLVADKEQLKTITTLKPKINIITKPTTIIYPSAKKLSMNLLSNDGSAGIRIVQDIFCKKLIKIFGRPIVSTSANISGEKQPLKFSEITREIKKNVDYIVNLRRNETMKTPSEILKIMSDGSIKKIR